MSFITEIKKIESRNTEKKEAKKKYFEENPKEPKKSILLYLTGVFSILFSMSTLTAIFVAGNYLMASIIGIFLLLVLIANEKFKVDSLVKLGKSKKLVVTPLLIASTTLLISLSSVFGIYTTINKIELNNKLYQTENTGVEIQSRIDSLDNILTIKLDSINNASNKTIHEQYLYYKDLADNTPIRYSKDKEKKAEYIANAAQYYDKLEVSKKELAKRIEVNLKEEREKKKLQGNINESTEGTSEIIKYIISSLAFIVEVIIIGIAFNLGRATVEYEDSFSNWAMEKDNFIKEEEDKLYNSINFTKFNNSIRILKLVNTSKRIGDPVSKKELKEFATLSNVNYGDRELNELRSLFISLKIFNLQSNNITILNLDLEKSTVKLDNLFSSLDS